MAKGDALKMLQKKCGVTPDGAFGPNTARAIAAHYKLNAKRGAHLLGQAAHESGNFMVSEENLNYRASTMCRVWPSRFKSEVDAEPYARNPEKLANKVYADRMGNGSEASGDGYKNRGRGFIQLTGATNIKQFAEHIGRDSLVDDPSPIADELAMDSAIFFFEKNGLFGLADKGVNDSIIKSITKRVNGGYHGLDDRIEKTKKIYGWLNS
jgi:putative chitinase